jgi:CRP-like cAMP-binding protein
MDSFFQVISHFTALSPLAKTDLGLHLKRVEFPKGHLLVKADTVCSHFYFIESGLSRTFYLKDGKDVTDWISDENSFACSIISFITRKPDRRNIELLETSVLYSLHHDEMEMLCAKHHDVERLFRRIVNSGMVQMQQKFDDLHFATASQRYQALTIANPSFLQRVPLGMIASYLGITQETLSRIRSQA